MARTPKNENIYQTGILLKKNLITTPTMKNIIKQKGERYLKGKHISED